MASRTHALIILDGFGEPPADYPREWDAVSLAAKPNFDRLRATYPGTLIKTSGHDVGLPRGIMGNSEVGHLNLGAGRVVWQDITRIDREVEQDDLRSVEPVRALLEGVRQSGKTLHIIGLTSDGCVHSVDRHYFAVLRLAKALGLGSHQVVQHCFTDGRDTPPRSGLGHVRAIRDWMEENRFGRVGTVIGRYYAMDRDKRWERTQLAYDALVRGAGTRFTDPVAAVEAAYAADVTDEFIKPCVIEDASGQPTGLIRDGDAIFCINYRADRVRQILRAFVEPGFDAFPRESLSVNVLTMTEVIEGLPAEIAFPPIIMSNTMGKVIAASGLTQLRIAETEKYPHVTFFFSGGEEAELPGEHRIMIPSPRDVATYDLKPEMSAPGIAAALVKALDDIRPDFVVLNFANCDMVGHTGVLDATRRAVEFVDAALGVVTDGILKRGGCAIVTADHGNAEQMWDFASDCPHTQHTTNPVPLILVDDERKASTLRDGGRLADISPTILAMMGHAQPSEMDGASLLA